jgi:hypothetical protein
MVGDLNDEIDAAGGIDGFEFIGFLARCFEARGTLLEDRVQCFFRHDTDARMMGILRGMLTLGTGVFRGDVGVPEGP